MQKQRTPNKGAILLSMLLGGAGLLLVLVLMQEWLTVYWNDNGYRWGTEGPNSWYYANRITYLTDTAAHILILTLASLLIIWARNRRQLLRRCFAFFLFGVASVSLLTHFERPFVERMAQIFAAFG